MEDLSALSRLYLSLGAGGLCLISIIGMFWYYMKHNNTKIEKMIENQTVFLKSLDAFAKSIEKMQKDQADSIDTAKTTNTLLDRSQGIIENNTKAMENFSQTLNNFSNYLQSQDSKLKNIEDDVKHLTLDNVKIVESLKHIR